MRTDVVLVPPLEPHLQVMAPFQNLSEPGYEFLAFVGRELVDRLELRPDREKTLPPCHWVRSYDGMHRLQRSADIQWISARPFVDLDPVWVGLGRLYETFPREGGGQTLEESLICRGESIVELVTRSPERVAARKGELGQAERSVVGRYGLELDIGVPERGLVTLLWYPGRKLVLKEVLTSRRTDYADLCVGNAKFRGVVEDRMNVQGGG